MFQNELEEAVLAAGEKAYRARQLFSWLHEKHAPSYEKMTNLPAAFRARLAEEYPLTTLRQVRRLISAKDRTEKYLFALPDGNVIESVLMRHDYGNSVCVSSQAGCAMGCRFCASTRNGLIRSLTASEMLEQVYRVEEISGERVSHVVVMGMGEPFMNYDSTVRFIRLLNDPKGAGISQRNITVSTCGLVPEMRRFAEEGLAVTLAVSLHAADDTVRKSLMPVANRYTVREVVEAAKYYFDRTGRRVSFEYALVRDVNDSDADVKKLASLLKGFPCHVNLIPVNTVTESGLARPGSAETADFHKKLEKYGINVTIRKEMGSDIDGACGQLRNSFLAPP